MPLIIGYQLLLVFRQS